MQSETVVLPNYATFHYAGFWMRFWAYLLDLIVIASMNGIIVYPIFRFMDLPLEKNHMFTPLSIATATTFYLYFIFMTKIFKQTIGKMVFGLKVIDVNNRSLTWSTVLFRELVGKFISKTILFIGFLVAAFSPKKQGIHDMIADTTVVHERTC
nr:RDD family protein [Anoxybacillus calidus]